MHRLIAVMFLLFFGVSSALAQSAGFTYQGRLTDGGTPANGVYDLQFGLWDSQSSGNQIGSMQSINSVPVMSGVFTLTLDFGVNAFSGAARFLEISARPSGSGSFTTLSPRQQITSTPYAVRSLRAATADSVPASGVPAGSGNYIQNTSSPQSGNFNITGSATVGQTVSGNIVNAGTQFNLGGSRVLSSNTDSLSLFVGVDTGQNNSTGFSNSFFGFGAGRTNTTGSSNSFFGTIAGVNNTSGSSNSFFGNNAGANNTTGQQNSFFGAVAGGSNMTGDLNAFFGMGAGHQNSNGDGNSFFGNTAGVSNTSGSFNSFFGVDAGAFNLGGSNNSFVGIQAGRSNTGGEFNTAIGAFADVIPGESFNPINATAIGAHAVVKDAKATAVGADALVTGNNATAIGANASVTQANSLVLGSISGVNFAIADTNVGIGTTAPSARLHIKANNKNILLGDAGCGPGVIGIGLESAFSNCQNYALLGGDGNIYINRPTNGTIIFREANGLNQVEIRPGGTVGIGTLGSGGSVSLCRNGAAAIATCGSSLRYKTEVRPFGSGLQLISRLQPVSFNWKSTHTPDIGLIAEEVAKVEPRLTFKNQNGEIEGVNYSQLTAVLINAVKEQQAQLQKQTELIERQQAQVNRQQQQLNALRKLACRSNPRANACRKFGVR